MTYAVLWVMSTQEKNGSECELVTVCDCGHCLNFSTILVHGMVCAKQSPRKLLHC